MREIKFRAKDLKGNWIYGTYAYGCFYPDSRKTHRIFPSGEEIEEETLGQYTGITDRNGKEAYEGDIVQIDNTDEVSMWVRGEKAIVEYKPGRFRIVTQSGEVNMMQEDMQDVITVIGNIYEHPHLIEVSA